MTLRQATILAATTAAALALTAAAPVRAQGMLPTIIANTVGHMAAAEQYRCQAGNVPPPDPWVAAGVTVTLYESLHPPGATPP